MVLIFVNLIFDFFLELVIVSVFVSFVFKYFVCCFFEVLGNEVLLMEVLIDWFYFYLVVIIVMDRGDNWEIILLGWVIVLIDWGIFVYFINYWYLILKEIICFIIKIIWRIVMIFLIFEFDSYILLCDILFRL